MYLESKNGYFAFAFAFSLITFTACNGTNSDSTGTVLGQDQVSGPPALIPSQNSQVPTPTPTPTATPTSTATPDPTITPTPEPTSTPIVGASCHTDDPNHLCLALKYVVYNDSKDTPVVNQQEAIANIKSINSVWNQCNVAFQIDQFLPVDPRDYGLVFNTANYGDLEDIRHEFEDDSTLLVVTTGNWNRNGSLGSTGANAWANMPGNDTLGVILESAVGTYPNLIAHELGHYLNLDHYSSSANLMNPIIYDTSSQLTSSQCNEARSAINYFWKKMKR
jgi:hypothetical protein